MTKLVYFEIHAKKKETYHRMEYTKPDKPNISRNMISCSNIYLSLNLLDCWFIYGKYKDSTAKKKNLPRLMFWR